MTQCITVDGWLTGEELIAVNRAWPAADWPGWIDYAEAGHGEKKACDAIRELPDVIAAVLVRLAALNPGAWLGMPEAAADLSLFGAGLHAMPRGSGLAAHLDADTHARLGLHRAWSAVLWVHNHWCDSWGGELCLHGSPGREVFPSPGRLALFDCRALRHHVEAVRCPQETERRSLALFGYLPEAGPRARPRALFGERKDDEG